MNQDSKIYTLQSKSVLVCIFYCYYYDRKAVQKTPRKLREGYANVSRTSETRLDSQNSPETI